jgi:hypothetical protein
MRCYDNTQFGPSELEPDHLITTVPLLSSPLIRRHRERSFASTDLFEGPDQLIGRSMTSKVGAARSRSITA